MQKVKNLPGERWKQIRNSQYWISNKGRLITTTWKGSDQQRFMTPANDGGYYKTVLVINGVNCSTRVHRLVGEYFVRNKDPKRYTLINHLDFNTLNNDHRNLEWTDNSGNSVHSWAAGRQSNEGSKNPFAKLTESQVVQIRKLFKPHVFTRVDLAKRFKVTEGCIKSVLYKGWKHI